MLGKNVSKKHWQHKQVIFFLDECLPYHLADILKRVGYPITSWYQEFQGQQGAKEPWLIPYLGAKEYIWITKDDAAKREHESEIRAAMISVVWVRGLERLGSKPKRNVISTKDLHRMLTDKLDYIEQEIASSKAPLYFMLYLKTGQPLPIPACKKIPLETFFKKVS